MKRVLMTLALLIAVTPGMALAQTPASTPMPIPTDAERTSCDDIDEYGDIFAEKIMPLSDSASALWGDDTDLTELRPSQLREVSEVFDQSATALETVADDDIPLIVKPYHDALITMLSVGSNTFLAMANGGIFALIAYAEPMEEAADAMNDASAYARYVCGDQWTLGLNDD